MMAPANPTFDLTTERWMTVIDQHNLTKNVSLRDVLKNAHEYQCLVGEVPTQTVGPDPGSWTR